jgi:hypothetical protein
MINILHRAMNNSASTSEQSSLLAFPNHSGMLNKLNLGDENPQSLFKSHSFYYSYLARRFVSDPEQAQIESSSTQTGFGRG